MLQVGLLPGQPGFDVLDAGFSLVFDHDALVVRPASDQGGPDHHRDHRVGQAAHRLMGFHHLAVLRVG